MGSHISVSLSPYLPVSLFLHPYPCLCFRLSSFFCISIWVAVSFSLFLCLSPVSHFCSFLSHSVIYLCLSALPSPLPSSPPTTTAKTQTLGSKGPQPHLPTTLFCVKVLPEVLHFPNCFSFVANSPNEEGVVGSQCSPRTPSVPPQASLGPSCPCEGLKQRE